MGKKADPKEMMTAETWRRRRERRRKRDGRIETR